MDIFLSLSPEHPPHISPTEAIKGHVRQARLAREAGFAGVTVGQHLTLSGVQWFPPIPLLSRLVPECEGMTLGTGVLILPFFHPVMAAEAMAFLDAATGGRTLFGVAAGWSQPEFEALGVPLDRRGDRTVESISLIRRLWTESGVSHDGDFYKVDDLTLALRPVQRPQPPLWAGASTRSGAARLAPHVDGLMHSAHLPVTRLLEVQRAFQEARPGGSTKPASVGALRNVFVAPSNEEAWSTALPFVRASYERFTGAGLIRDVVGRGPSALSTVDETVQEVLVVGDPEVVTESLLGLQRRLGLKALFVRMQWHGMPSQLVERSIALFAEEVLPRLAGAGVASNPDGVGR